MSEDGSIKLFVGVDWGYTGHSVCVLDRSGQGCCELQARVNGEVVSALLRVRGERPAASVAVAIERRDLALVDELVEAGYRVFTINPKQVDRFRDRFSVAGAKDDRRDAFVLASSLRTDTSLFYEVAPPREEVLALKTLTRLRGQLLKQERVAGNMLAERVYRLYPALRALCPGANQVFFWELLARILASPRKMQRRTVEKILSATRVRRVTVDEVYASVRAPSAPLPALVVEHLRMEMGLWLEQVRQLHRQRRVVDRRLEALLSSMASTEPEVPSDVDIIRSVVGFGPTVTGILVGELGRPLAERNLQRLRALCGVAPVTKQSGKSSSVRRRTACNRHARQALFHASMIAARNHAHFGRRYDELRKRGCTHGRALRGLGDTILRMLVAMLKDRKLFEHDRWPTKPVSPSQAAASLTCSGRRRQDGDTGARAALTP